MAGRPPPPDRWSGQTSCKKMSAVGWTTVELGLLSIGVLLVILGSLVGRHWEYEIDKRFQEEMVLSETSRGVEEWISPSLSIVSKIYLWNWTNAADIKKKDYIPSFEEVGPYVFREKHKKMNLTWNENGTVTYQTLKFWYFDRESSSGDLSENITSVNTVAATLSSMLQHESFFTKRAVSLALVSTSQKIWWTKTADELLFKGFDNPIVKIGSYISNAPAKFGYFYGRNGTNGPDVFNMATGALDIYSIGNVKFWNNANSTTAHEGQCSSVRGSLGELWSPHLTQQSTLVMYTSDMCRPISYYYVGESSHNEIPSLVFASTPETVDNGTLVPENKCFCPKDGCRPSGFFDLRSCKEKAPILMSMPHLYLTDPIYRDSITGMNPDPNKHKFFFELEARTGVPMKASARLQLNVNITCNNGITAFRGIKDVVVPVFWIETLATLPESHTSGVKFLLKIISLGPYISSVVIAVGAILILALIIRRFCRRKQRTKKPSAAVKLKSIEAVLAMEKSSEFPLLDRSPEESQINSNS